MASADAALARLCDPGPEVSAHYLIDEAGQVFALVAEEMRAWHAGAGSWAGITDVNSHSVGIELANSGFEPFPQPQMQALEELLGGVLTRWSIPPYRVIGHSDMAPGRKIDPGPRFDWRRLARQGLSVWPQATLEPAARSDFAADLRRFGYPDQPLSVLLSAFRLRFAPGGKGPLSHREMGIAADLARRFPVDGLQPSA